MVDTYQARRRLKMAPDVWREPGELVPEAHTYFRLDSWLHTGYLIEVEVSEKDFRAAVKKFCPDLAKEIDLKAGLAPDVRLTGPHKTPAAPDRQARPQLISLLDEDGDDEGDDDGTSKRGRRRAPAKDAATKE